MYTEFLIKFIVRRASVVRMKCLCSCSPCMVSNNPQPHLATPRVTHNVSALIIHCIICSRLSLKNISYIGPCMFHHKVLFIAQCHIVLQGTNHISSHQVIRHTQSTMSGFSLPILMMDAQQGKALTEISNKNSI